MQLGVNRSLPLCSQGSLGKFQFVLSLDFTEMHSRFLNLTHCKPPDRSSRFLVPYTVPLGYPQNPSLTESLGSHSFFFLNISNKTNNLVCLLSKGLESMPVFCAHLTPQHLSVKEILELLSHSRSCLDVTGELQELLFQSLSSGEAWPSGSSANLFQAAPATWQPDCHILI